MPKTTKTPSNKVFDALAAPLRLRILRLLYSQGPLSYSDIMSRLNLNPNRDAGKFAYHLGKLHDSGLLTTDETRKYTYTPLGSLMVEVTQSVETESLRQRRKLLVRSSRLAMEEFDRNKIVKALMREAGVPSQLARKIAEETEERLLKLDALYLTAPLIREFTNAVLIEKGLHEYRHRHTRLGIPVFDVAQTIKQAQTNASEIHEVSGLMAKNVLTEFVLLDILPRRVADAHLDGSLHLKNIENWVLKPDSIQHDLRPFLESGFQQRRSGLSPIALGPPRNLREALAVISSVISSCSREVSTEQTIPHLNVFLAPFSQGASDDELRGNLENFLVTVNQLPQGRDNPSTTLVMDISVPKSLRNAKVNRPNDKTGRYEALTNEAQRIARSLVDILIENAKRGPVLTPRIIFNTFRDNASDNEVEDLLIQVHRLAAATGAPVFTNLSPSWQRDVAYDSNGVRLAATWRNDWELDTIRTGTLGTVGINLPRAAYEAKGNESKFLNALGDYVSMAAEALKAKATAMESSLTSGLLSVLSKPTPDEHYFRSRNATFLVGLIGLNEAMKALTGKQMHEDKTAVSLATKTISQLSAEARRLSLNTGFRVDLSHGVIEEASQRLAELDVERYGWGVVNAQGTHDTPYYTDVTAVPLEAGISLQERLRLEGVFHPLLRGGHFLPIELPEPQNNSEILLRVTKDIIQGGNIGAYAFTRTYGHCFNCRRTQGGIHQKCPNCGATQAYTTYSRPSATYEPLNRWPKGKASTLEKRVRYTLRNNGE